MEAARGHGEHVQIPDRASSVETPARDQARKSRKPGDPDLARVLL